MDENLLISIVLLAIFVFCIFVTILMLSKEKGHTIYGIGSLIFGIMGILLFFVLGAVFLFYKLFPLYISLQVLIGVLATILGVFSYWIKKPRDDYGIAGFALGLIALFFALLSITVWHYVA